MRLVSVSEFNEHFFDCIEHSAFRLEALDHYTTDYENADFQRYRANEPFSPELRRALTWWAKGVGEVRATGGRMERVHVITEPPSEYVRFEMVRCYPLNQAAGEDIRILSRTTADELDLPHLDYWLYDEQWSYNMIYDETGKLLHLELVEDPDTIAQHIRWRDTALRAATPVLDYLEQHDLEPVYL